MALMKLSEVKASTFRMPNPVITAPDTESNSAPEPKPAKEPVPKSRLPAGERITRLLPGNEWMKLGTIMGSKRQLCGPLWYEGELCVLFADTNVGKSLLGVQIADMLSTGGAHPTACPELRPEILSTMVIYADFELSTVQFTNRYSSETTTIDSDGNEVSVRTPYVFSNYMLRAEMSYQDIDDHADPKAYTRPLSEILIDDLEYYVEAYGAQVLIIDNITFMAEGTEQAADALPLMKKLLKLKRKYQLSILVLAHTPKRNLSNPLTRNDLQGSKMIINFVDSAFAIGESVLSKELRYIKQIKQRNTGIVYGADNVLDCVIGQVTPEFVGFKTIGSGPEERHLVKQTEKGDKHRRAQELLKKGYSHKEIAEAMGISRAQTYRYLSTT